jgi:nucleotide-binding universal stress UspA family protein
VRKDTLLEDISDGEDFKIAIGFDPEDNPSPLFEYSFELAHLLCSELVVVHAVENLVNPTPQEDEEKIKLAVEKILEKIPAGLKEGINLSVEILYGKDIETFSQFVEKRGIKLFAFYFYKKLLGKTIAETFVEKLPTALLAVREKHSYRPIKKILVPLDFSGISLKQKEFIARMLTCRERLEVVFFHVLDKRDSSEEEEVKLLFEEIFEGMGELKLAYGNPEEEILKELKEGGYNLVMVGRVGKGLNGICGKVTKEILEEAPCPTVVV